MPHDGRAVANAVLDIADSEGIRLSNLSLQKVIFFCHAWHLVETGDPLIKHQFEAWQHGPVLQFLYRQFKTFENKPIQGRATRMNPATGGTEVAYESLGPETVERIKRVVRFYGKLEPWDLVDLSHVKGGPWDRVWNHDGRVNPGMKISHEDIRAYYQSNNDMGVTQ